MRAMRGVVCVCVCLVWSAVASIREWVVLYVRAGVPHKSERLAGGMMEQQVLPMRHERVCADELEHEVLSESSAHSADVASAARCGWHVSPRCSE